MQTISRTVRTAAMGLALSMALAAQSGTAQQQANPGYGPQVPNDVSLSGGQPHSNSTYQKDRNGNQGFDLGWLGLLGLAGLFGIGRGRKSEATVAHEMQNSGSNRS